MKVRVEVFAVVFTVAALAACGTPGAPVPPSLELPFPSGDLTANRKAGRVVLSWTPPARTTDNRNLRLKKLGPTLVCRGVNDFPMAKCAQIIGQVPPAAPPVAAKGEKNPPPRPRTAYSDALPLDLQQMYPAGFATYAVEAMNKRWRSAGLSNQVRIPLAPTLPPPQQVRAEFTATGITVFFACPRQPPPASALQYTCRVYRRQADTDATIVLRNVPAGNAACDEHVAGDPAVCQISDNGFELEKTYSYWVTVVTEVAQNGRKVAEIEGDDSSAATVFTRDIFPPAVPAGLEAVASGVGQKSFIDLTWAPNTDADLAGYNLYRREGPTPDWTRLNSQLLTTPAFRDENVASGRTYAYAVTAIDLRGNESARSEPATEKVP